MGLDDVADPAAHRRQFVDRHPALGAVEVEAEDAAAPFAPIVDVDDLHSVLHDERLGNLPHPLHQTVHLKIKKWAGGPPVCGLKMTLRV